MDGLVKLSKDSKQSDFFCPCCNEGGLDAGFMAQLLRFLAFTGLGELVSTSGYRCPKHNLAVGGTLASRHIIGHALDLRAPTVHLKTIILDAAHKAGINGIGLGASFLHLDDREIPAKWTYPKKS